MRGPPVRYFGFALADRGPVTLQTPRWPQYDVIVGPVYTRPRASDRKPLEFVQFIIQRSELLLPFSICPQTMISFPRIPQTVVLMSTSSMDNVPRIGIRRAAFMIIDRSCRSYRSFESSNYCRSHAYRSFSLSRRSRAHVDHAANARALNEKGLQVEESQLEETVSSGEEKQVRTPWHREGSKVPPVQQSRSRRSVTKGEAGEIGRGVGIEFHMADDTPGKLLTTPSRLLKLILPLTTLGKDQDQQDLEPLALLVHPQQPLSYLERLIQSELPTISDAGGKGTKIPAVHFRAEDSASEETDRISTKSGEEEHNDEDRDASDSESHQQIADLRGGPGEGGVESYSGKGREGPSDRNRERRFVRWSASTEIGDFIRDAARGREFAVEIEGAPDEIRVGVPSFNDRTHYLRLQLQKTSRKIMGMAAIKTECDLAAHKGAQRVALAGFGALAGWWYVVYRLTFETDYGWDTMEPVTVSTGMGAIDGPDADVCPHSTWSVYLPSWAAICGSSTTIGKCPIDPP